MKFALIVCRTLAAAAAALATFTVNGHAIAQTLGAHGPNVVRVEGVHAAVEIERDRYGVPHVRAKNEWDAHFGLGFAHAQDRLWQMEFQRRLGNGRLAEVLGAKLLPTDRLFRTLGLRRTAEAVAHGEDLYVVTSKGAPRYKVVRTSLVNPDLARATTVVPPGEAVVGGVFAGGGALRVAGDALYVQLLDGGIGRLLRVPFGDKARPERVTLPFDGTIRSVSSDARLPGVLAQMTSWVKAPAVYAYDPRAGRFSDTGLQPLGPLDEPADVEAVEVKVRAADGTLVPLSIVHRRGLKLDGNNPTLIHGYGSYGISQLPSYNPQLMAWFERGGVYAVAHVRGGGEYGEEWHRAGQKRSKPNTWRDFIACAEYLVEKKYTTPARLAGMGMSAGAILIGRAVTERPDLFRAAIIGVGLTDMLRYETTANGVPNVAEFGSVRTREGFEALREMSAYHHVRDGAAYPAVLLTAGINDPRVDFWLPAKMAARLQAATSSGRPVLLRVDYEGGHGVGSTRRQFDEEVADFMTFLLWQFGDPAFRPRAEEADSR